MLSFTTRRIDSTTTFVETLGGKHIGSVCVPGNHPTDHYHAIAHHPTKVASDEGHFGSMEEAALAVAKGYVRNASEHTA